MRLRLVLQIAVDVRIVARRHLQPDALAGLESVVASDPAGDASAARPASVGGHADDCQAARLHGASSGGVRRRRCDVGRSRFRHGHCRGLRLPRARPERHCGPSASIDGRGDAAAVPRTAQSATTPERHRRERDDRQRDGTRHGDRSRSSARRAAAGRRRRAAAAAAAARPCGLPGRAAAPAAAVLRHAGASERGIHGRSRRSCVRRPAVARDRPWHAAVVASAPAQASSARENSPTVWKRADGFFSSARITAASTFGGRLAASHAAAAVPAPAGPSSARGRSRRRTGHGRPAACTARCRANRCRSGRRLAHRGSARATSPSPCRRPARWRVRCSSAVERAGDAEVHDLHLAAVRQHDVGRLDVAVHDAALVRMLDAVERPPKDARAPARPAPDRRSGRTRPARSPATYSMTMNCMSPSCRNAWTLATLGWLSLRVELRLAAEALEEERVGKRARGAAP